MKYLVDTDALTVLLVDASNSPAPPAPPAPTPPAPPAPTPPAPPVASGTATSVPFAGPAINWAGPNPISTDKATPFAFDFNVPAGFSTAGVAIPADLQIGEKPGRADCTVRNWKNELTGQLVGAKNNLVLVTVDDPRASSGWNLPMALRPGQVNRILLTLEPGNEMTADGRLDTYAIVGKFNPARDH